MLPVDDLFCIAPGERSNGAMHSRRTNVDGSFEPSEGANTLISADRPSGYLPIGCGDLKGQRRNQIKHANGQDIQGHVDEFGDDLDAVAAQPFRQANTPQLPHLRPRWRQ